MRDPVPFIFYFRSQRRGVPGAHHQTSKNNIPSLDDVAHSHRPLVPSSSLGKKRHAASFAESFPLSPELWQEWIVDRRAAGGEDALEDVLVLYGRAFADYQCAKLWPGYLETLEESLDVSPRVLPCPLASHYYYYYVLRCSKTYNSGCVCVLYVRGM